MNTPLPPCIASAGHKIHGVAIDLRASEELGGVILLIVCVVVMLASVTGFIEMPDSAKRPVWQVDTEPQTIILVSAQ